MCKYICLYLDCTMYIYKVYCTIISNVYLIMFHLSISFWSDIYKQGRQSGLRSMGVQLDGAENFGAYEANSCSKIDKIMAPKLTTFRAEAFTSNKWQRYVLYVGFGPQTGAFDTWQKKSGMHPLEWRPCL